MSLSTLRIDTNYRTEFVDITVPVKRIVDQSNVCSGACLVYIPHTTAAVTINENADPSVVRDMLHVLNKIVPFEDGYTHAEGNSAAHMKASMLGSSVSIPLSEKHLMLGTWQGIYFCEFDGPRTRSVHVHIAQSTTV